MPPSKYTNVKYVFIGFVKFVLKFVNSEVRKIKILVLNKTLKILLPKRYLLFVGIVRGGF